MFVNWKKDQFEIMHYEEALTNSKGILKKETNNLTITKFFQDDSQSYTIPNPYQKKYIFIGMWVNSFLRMDN